MFVGLVTRRSGEREQKKRKKKMGPGRMSEIIGAFQPNRHPQRAFLFAFSLPFIPASLSARLDAPSRLPFSPPTMPRSSWLSSHTSASHLPNLLTPSSERAPSLANARVNPQNIPIPQTPFGSQSGWGNDDILSTSTPSSSYFPSSVPSTPAYEPSYSTGSSFHGHSSVEIQLDQDQVVLRGAGGDTNPARLAGTVILHLVESTNLKDVVLTLTGKAKVQFGEGAGSVLYFCHFLFF